MLTNEEKAILDMISYAEGTLGVSKNGYDVTFNFYKIPDWDYSYTKGHQNKAWLIKSGDYSSTAAGRYQILGFTWLEMSKKLLNTDNAPFNKENQNIIGAALVRGRNKIQKLDKATIPKPPDLKNLNSSNFTKLLDSLSPEWTSIPYSGNGGKKSYSGQKTKYTASELYMIYKEALDIYNG